MMLLVGAAVAGEARCDEAVAGDDEWNAWLAPGDAPTNADDALGAAGLKAGADEFDAIVRNDHNEPTMRELQWARNYHAAYSSASYSFGDFSYGFVDMTDYPTTVPIPAPSAASSPDIVVPVTVGLNIGMSGISCAEYGDDEEDVMNQALAAHIAGATEDDFSDHTCSAARRLGETLAAAKANKATAQQRVRGRGRSLLSSDAISLYTEVTVDATEFSDDDIMGSVLSAVNTAVSSGALASSVAAYAAAAGLTSMDALTVTGVTVTTMTPTASPDMPSPSTKPSSSFSTGSRVLSPTASPDMPSPSTKPSSSFSTGSRVLSKQRRLLLVLVLLVLLVLLLLLLFFVSEGGVLCKGICTRAPYRARYWRLTSHSEAHPTYHPLSRVHAPVLFAFLRPHEKQPT